ncbi:MAG TPA: hypothetical protein VJP06_06155 [Thermoplasmata archaeon]|nr:hypothetical protein [Thermoplasmata archaeon]
MREPGLHLRALPRRVGLSLRSVRYHLDALVAESAVTSHRSGGFERWFPSNTFSSEDRALISALHVRGQRAILRYLLEDGPARFVSIQSAIGRAAPSVVRDIDRLVSEGLVEQTPDRLYRLHDIGATRMRLALFRQRYPDLLGDAAQEIFEDTR